MDRRLLALLLVSGLLGACIVAPPRASATYTPPPSQTADSSEWTRRIDRPFDQVWEALVDHASGAFFAIDNFEKESGLMTLTFGASQIEQYVDGGHWEYQQKRGMDPYTGRYTGADVDFAGNYVSYLERYCNGKLAGRMNLFVRPVNTSSTEVKVRSRYVVSASVTQSGNITSMTWSFDTGGSDTVVLDSPTKGTEPTRTMRPTHKAERAILEAIEQMGR